MCLRCSILFIGLKILWFLVTCAQSCPMLSGSTNCSPPGSSADGVFQARILEWVSISFSRRSSQPRDWTRVSRISWIGRQILNQLRHLSANSLQSCPTVCDPLDCSPPGSSVHGILQARILKWLLYSLSLRAQKIIIWTRLEVQSRSLATRGSIPEPNWSQSTTYAAENSMFCFVQHWKICQRNTIIYLIKDALDPVLTKKNIVKKQSPSTRFYFGEHRKQSWGG